MQLVTFKFDNLDEILVALEEAFKAGSTVDRRAEAIRLLNQDIDIAFLPEGLEAEIVIGPIVDAVIWAWNQALGHDWLDIIKAKLAAKKVAQ